MRTFIIYSQTAQTSNRINDLKKSGRWDILLHSIISALFASNTFRNDVSLELILMGEPNPGKHITIKYSPENTISKKDLKKLIEIALKKSKPNKTIEVHPGVFIEDKTIDLLIEEKIKENKKIFMLDINGIHLKELIENNKEFNLNKKELKEGIYILGDYDGFDKKTKKYLKKNSIRISLGEIMYFTSQAITIINYELDNIENY
jgi:tRNA pseudouridine-54 N-methylase